MTSEPSLAAFIGRIRDALGHPPDLIEMQLGKRPNEAGALLFLETMCEKREIEQTLLAVLSFDQTLDTDGREHGGNGDFVGSHPLVPERKIRSPEEAVQGLLEGCALRIVSDDDGVVREATLYRTGTPAHRTVSTPSTEVTVRGPNESFVESLVLNMSLIRKRIKHPGLRIERMTLGSVTRTNVVMIFLEPVANPDIIAECRRRLQNIRTDGVLDSAYVEEWIQDSVSTPFATLLNTERPDVVASHLLEGSVAVLVDGSPIALVGPYTFYQFFTSPEDYYQRADIATVLRWLRMLAFLLAIFVPPFYISVISYHQELIPNPLLINIAAQREGVPFPSFVETIVMLVTFEVLREAGLRMPRAVGQAVSIVGALVLGESAVQAGLVSPIMIIVVALTAIANFVSPSYSFGISQRILQFMFMTLAAFLGLFGVLCGTLFLLVHLVSLKSFGVPYFSPMAPVFWSDLKDIWVRAPHPWMTRYPAMLRPKRRTRM